MLSYISKRYNESDIFITIRFNDNWYNSYFNLETKQ